MTSDFGCGKLDLNKAWENLRKASEIIDNKYGDGNKKINTKDEVSLFRVVYKEIYNPDCAITNMDELVKTSAKSLNIFTKEEIQHKETVHKIADSWAKTFKIENEYGEFDEFVEKLYQVAEELNLTETNDGKWNSEKYPTKQDQVIDEMMGAFAQESQFDPKATSARGGFHGIFQFSTIGMKDIQQRGSKLKNLTMSQFKQLSRNEQLDYMKEYVEVCKRYYSNLGDSVVSPKQVYAMWMYPRLGNPNNRVDKYTGASLMAEKQNVIKAKQAERDRFSKE